MKLKMCIIIIWILFPLISYADNSTNQLAQILTNLQSMQANFVQTVLDGQGRKLQQTSGKIALQRPGKFRWEVQSPTPQLLIADGKRTWFYDKSLEQVTVQKQQATTQGSPAMLLSGSTQNLLVDFTVSTVPDKNYLVFKLIPKTKNNMFQAVILSFAQQKLAKMQLADNLGQTTVITFSQVQVNPNLATSLFHFTPPHGVDVVSE